MTECRDDLLHVKLEKAIGLLREHVSVTFVAQDTVEVIREKGIGKVHSLEIVGELVLVKKIIEKLHEIQPEEGRKSHVMNLRS